jgi:uncharacterized protein (DUF2147 family)
MYKKISKIVFLLLLAFQMAFAGNPDDIIGVWKNGEGTGLIQIFKKGDKFYGKLVWLKEPTNPDGTPKTDDKNPNEKLRKMPLKGLELLRGFKYSSESKWDGGDIYDPENGKDYSCKMKLTDPNTLEVRGYIGISLIGRTDVWKRQDPKK